MTLDNQARRDAFDRAVEQTVSIVERNEPVIVRGGGPLRCSSSGLLEGNL